MRPPADEIGILEDYGHDFSGPVPPSIWARIAAKDPHEMPDMYLDRNLLFEEPSTILARIEKELANK